jgi:hypothetical protein
MRKILLVGAAITALAAAALAAPEFEAHIDQSGSGLSALPFSFVAGAADLGESATISVAQGGFHGANPASWETFITDNGAPHAIGMLPADFPPEAASGESAPGVTLDFDLGSVVGVGEVRVWCQNNDGRAWINVDIETSADGISYTPLIESCISELDGTFPSANVGSASTASLVRIKDDAGGLLATTQYIRIEFLNVSGTDLSFRDEYDAGNGSDLDGLARAFESPNIQQVEILDASFPVGLTVFEGN